MCMFSRLFEVLGQGQRPARADEGATTSTFGERRGLEVCGT